MNKSSQAIVDHILSLRGTDKEVQVFPHIRVDGDALGSAVAMAMVLRKLEIPARVFLDEPISERLSFLEIPADMIVLFDEALFSEYIEKQAGVLAVDCSEADRMGKCGRLFANAQDRMILDHHISSGESKGLKHVAPHAAATAEIALYVIQMLETKTEMVLLDCQIANFLMVGLQSDTGRFSYQNTTPATLRAAADLMEHGANVYINAYNLFDITDVARLRLTSSAMANTQFLFGGKLAIAIVTLDMIRDCGASDDSADGLVSNLRDVKGVIVSFVIRETASSEVRVNIRSHTPFDASAFAEDFGGGGHQRAAGFSLMEVSSQDICRQIIEKAGEVLSTIK